MEQWYKFIREDVFFAFFESKKSIYEPKKGKAGVLLADFKEMQSIAETEYAELNQQYDLLITPERDSPNSLPNTICI